jgi:2-polyprenyl-3-methyl-5-hydroxy-6-metoxy-1,4-benzoquinol methylase
MITQPSAVLAPTPLVVSVPPGRHIELADGQRLSLESLSLEALLALQGQQEPRFAKKIAASRKDSAEREQLIRTAYASVCAILDEQAKRRDVAGVFSMGMDPRYAELVLKLCRAQQCRGLKGGLFELGCSAGSLLGQADRAGFRVGGLEVVPELLRRAKEQVSTRHHDNLFLGDFRRVDLSRQLQSFSVAYWNDVFEHIPTDEISDYLSRLYDLLEPGGLLVTITPNWHMRPSDVTMNFRPPRSEAEGFHLKEYTLGEVCRLLRGVGFTEIATPSFISRRRIYLYRLFGLTGLKCILEPLLEYLPYPCAVQACRRFGLSCTIATKPRA